MTFGPWQVGSQQADRASSGAVAAGAPRFKSRASAADLLGKPRRLCLPVSTISAATSRYNGSRSINNCSLGTPVACLQQGTAAVVPCAATGHRAPRADRPRCRRQHAAVSAHDRARRRWPARYHANRSSSSTADSRTRNPASPSSKITGIPFPVRRSISGRSHESLAEAFGGSRPTSLAGAHQLTRKGFPGAAAVWVEQGPGHAVVA